MRRLYPVLGEVEQACVGRPQVQHRGDPFQGVGVPAGESDPTGADCLIHPEIVHKRLIERTGEDGRGVIGDRELHRHHGRHRADEGGCGAGEHIHVSAGPCLAAVQQHEPGHRIGDAEQIRQRRRCHQLPMALLVCECDHALVPGRVKSAVPDEVEDVAAPIQRLLRRLPALARHPIHRDEFTCSQGGKQLLEPVLLGVGFERIHIPRQCGHSEYPERRGYGQRTDRFRYVDIAHDRAAPA